MELFDLLFCHFLVSFKVTLVATTAAFTQDKDLQEVINDLTLGVITLVDRRIFSNWFRWRRRCHKFHLIAASPASQAINIDFWDSKFFFLFDFHGIRLG